MGGMQDIAEQNFEAYIARNPYPGRGIVVGRSADGESWQIVYWLMGRSEHSRNRRLVVEGGTLRTVPVDESLVEDPSLIIYEAILERPGQQIVSNGDQTRTIYEGLEAGGRFEDALETREREPDAPNYTPRISALLTLAGPEPSLRLSILKANPADPERTDRTTFAPASPPPGIGLCLTTYEGDGSPLPSFRGDPRPMPLAASAEETAERYWAALDADNRIALAVKEIPPAGGAPRFVLRNRHGD